MEQNFQTSFMPKKPMIEDRAVASRPVGLLAVLAIFIFFATLLATGGLYFYKGVMQKRLTTMQDQLNLAKNQFEPSKILQMQVLDKRLRASTEILDKHISVTPVFKILEALTMKTVRYTKFTYTLGDNKDSKIIFKLNGQAVGYRSIALQSDLFTEHNEIIDPVFSDLSLDDKGNVLFVLTFSVDPSFIDYGQALKAQTANPDTRVVLPVTQPAPTVPQSTTNTTTSSSSPTTPQPGSQSGTQPTSTNAPSSGATTTTTSTTTTTTPKSTTTNTTTPVKTGPAASPKN